MMRYGMLFLLALAGPALAAVQVPDETVKSEVPVDEIKRFVQVFQAIRDSYVEPMTDEEIMQAGLRGLLQDIDPHSSYLSARQAREFNDLSEGGYAGIGIESDERDPTRIRVVSPFDDTPAQRAGLRAGDFIIAINGVPVDNASRSASPERLRGKVGTKVLLTVVRPGEKAPFQEVPGSEKDWPADLVLLATGFVGPEKTVGEMLGLEFQRPRGNWETLFR